MGVKKFEYDNDRFESIKQAYQMNTTNELVGKALDTFDDTELMIAEVAKRLGIDVKGVNTVYLLLTVFKDGCTKFKENHTYNKIDKIVSSLKKDNRAVTQNAIENFKGEIDGQQPTKTNRNNIKAYLKSNGGI